MLLLCVGKGHVCCSSLKILFSVSQSNVYCSSAFVRAMQAVLLHLYRPSVLLFCMIVSQHL